MPILYAIISYFLYASMAYVLEQKLSAYTVPSVLVLQYLAALPLVAAVLASMRFGKQAIAWPSGAGLWWALGAGIIFFLADTFIVSAYATARKMGQEYLYAIVAVAILYPVFASSMKYLWQRKMPNGWFIASYALALVVILLATKGNAVDNARTP